MIQEKKETSFNFPDTQCMTKLYTIEIELETNKHKKKNRKEENKAKANLTVTYIK